MKNNFLLLSIMLFSIFSVSAQNTENSKIGITYSISKTSLLQNKIPGNPSIAFPSSATFGVNYIKPINKSLEWETGLEYSLFNVRSVSNADTINSTMTLINLPVGVRMNFANYFFANGGLMLDFTTNNNSPISNQTGVGVLLGLGGKYDFAFGGSLFLNPYAKIHSLIPFGSWSNHSRVLETGIRLGFTYRL